MKSYRQAFQSKLGLAAAKHLWRAGFKAGFTVALLLVALALVAGRFLGY